MQLEDSDDSGFKLRFAAAQIRNGGYTDMRQLLPVVVSGSREKRFWGCVGLAFAFADSGDTPRALSMAERAFEIWNDESGFIEQYLALLKSTGDAAQIKRVSKRAGMRFAARGEVWNALQHFNAAQYAEHSVGAGDRYQADYDILRAVETLAGVEAGKLPRHFNPERSKVRVAYLVYGASHTSSVLVRIALDLVRHHDRGRFDCAFFSPDPDGPFSLQQNRALFDAAGTQLRTVKAIDEQTCLFETASAIERFRPDLLVSFAALADFRQYYLFAKTSATARVSLCYGPPAQFVPHAADLAISATLHPAMDCPCDTVVIEIETTSPIHPDVKPVAETDAGELIVLAAGRSEKFQDRHYWEMILSVLARFPKMQFIAVGLASRPAFLEDMLATEAGMRVKVVGWLEDYQPVLARADVVIDTFPSGGGLTILDAMALGIPVLAFANDYVEKIFDQTNWNPAEEFITEPWLIVSRGDFVAFASRLSELLTNPDKRRQLGAACRQRWLDRHGNPERMVRRMEAAYLSALTSIMAPVDVTLCSVTPVSFEAHTDESGKYHIANLPAGEYDAHFASGEIHHIAHFGGLYEGNSAADAQINVTLKSSMNCTFTARTDEKGVYSVTDLPPGEYKIAFSSGEMSRTVHGGGTFLGRAKRSAFSESAE